MVINLLDLGAWFRVYKGIIALLNLFQCVAKTGEKLIYNRQKKVFLKEVFNAALLA